MSCYRELATASCTHDLDLIVECVNIDYNKSTGPEPGTVRVVNESGAPSRTGGGRLEIFKSEWGSICNLKFNVKSA